MALLGDPHHHTTLSNTSTPGSFVQAVDRESYFVIAPRVNHEDDTFVIESCHVDGLDDQKQCVNAFTSGTDSQSQEGVNFSLSKMNAYVQQIEDTAATYAVLGPQMRDIVAMEIGAKDFATLSQDLERYHSLPHQKQVLGREIVIGAATLLGAGFALHFLGHLLWLRSNMTDAAAVIIGSGILSAFSLIAVQVVVSGHRHFKNRILAQNATREYRHQRI